MPTQRYGMPFRGYNAVLKPHEAPNDVLTGDSRDMLYDPNSKSFRRRLGSNAAVSAVLPTSWAARARQIFGIAESSTAGESPGVLYTHEPSGFGVVFVRYLVSLANYVLGSEFGTTHYPSSGGTANSVHRFKMVPLGYYGPRDSTQFGEGGYTRATHEYARRFIAPGARRVVQAGDDLYCPALDGTPFVWRGKTFNTSTSSGTAETRIFPWGHIPPLFPPCRANPAVVSITAIPSVGGDAAFEDGDTFYCSVVFQYEDDSFSMPFIPRAKNDALTAGYGLVTVGGIGSNEKYQAILWEYIPIGPKGVKRRILLRTPKQKLVSATDVLTINPADLRILEIIDNNTTVQWWDRRGSDAGLTKDNTVPPDVPPNPTVRFDHIWPKRARYCWHSDQRFIAGYVEPNGAAIILAPTGLTASRDINGDSTGLTPGTDDSTRIFGAVSFLCRITTSTLVLRKISAGVATDVTISLTSARTIQDVVDEINSTTAASNSGEWAAALVPGVDATAASTDLLPSYRTLANCSGSSGQGFITTSASTAAICVGMFVSGHASIPSNTIVTAVAATTITLGNTSGVAATLTGNIAAATTLDLHFDFGDDALLAGQKGYMRCFANSFPGVVYLTRTKVNSYPIRKRDVWFTGGGPGHASDAIENFYAGNRRTAPRSFGILQGGGALKDFAGVLYSNGIMHHRNVRGGGTGLDDDYRMVAVNKKRGCCAWGSVVEGDGWLLYLTSEGLFALGDREVCISGAMFDPGRSRGAFVYEIQQGLASTVAEAADLSRFFCMAAGGRILCSYRSSVTAATNNDRLARYDFSASTEASGVEELLDAEGAPFGWSAPYEQMVLGCMGAIIRSDGIQFWGNNDADPQGALIQFEIGDRDLATQSLELVGYCAMDMAGTMKKKSAQGGYVMYRKTGTGALLTFSRDKARATKVSLPLPSSGADPFTRARFELPQASRAPAEVMEIGIDDQGATQDPLDLYGFELEYEVLEEGVS